MPVFYSPSDYTVPLPSGHRFPMERYAETHATLRDAMGLPPVPTPPAYYLGAKPDDHSRGATAGAPAAVPPPGFADVTARDWATAVSGCDAAAAAWRSAPKALPSSPDAWTGGVVEIVEPRLATEEECGAGHALSFVAGYCDGSLPASEHRRIGFDWSPRFAERTRRITGGTVECAVAALTTHRARSRDGGWVGPGGIACNGAGGTHHGFPRHGEGFCIINDAAVVARLALYHPEWRRAHGIARVLILDLDVHQGNGTAACFARGWREACGEGQGGGEASPPPPPPGWAGLPALASHRPKGEAGTGSGASLVSAGEYSPALLQYRALHSDTHGARGDGQDGDFDVLTVSLHGAKNYPWSTRFPSLLDVDVPDGTGDEEYGALLTRVLQRTEALMRGHSPVQLAVLQRMNEAEAWKTGVGADVLPPPSLCGVEDVPSLPVHLRDAARRAREAAGGRGGEKGSASPLPPHPATVLGPLQGGEQAWYLPGQTLLLYQAGVDPLRHDRLGRLGLTRAGLHARNEAVFDWAERFGLPTVVTMGGGYSKPISASARAHTDVFMQAAGSWVRRERAWGEVVSAGEAGGNE